LLVIRLAIALVAVVAAARAMRPLCRIAGQPPVVADMAAGILLGPSFLGWVAPSVTAWLFAPAALGPLAQVAQVGVVLYMFVVGAELDFDRARTQARSTAWIALAGIVVPVALGALLATRIDENLLPDGRPLWQALFLGMAMAMTAFPVLARILADTGLMASPLGSRALSCAAVADLIVWATVGLMVGTFEQRSSAWMAPVFAATFVVGMLVVVRPAVTRIATTTVAEGWDCPSPWQRCSP
jgi:Kef-type K+ transport system membrane component KefB